MAALLAERRDTINEQVHLQSPKPKHSKDAQWFSEQLGSRLENVRQTVSSYAPWLLPEFTSLWDDPAINPNSARDLPALERMPDFIDALSLRLRTAVRSNEQPEFLYQRLEALLPAAAANALGLIQDLRKIAKNAGKLADEMDFRFLLNQRKLLSIGFDVKSQQVHSACYDLLATESRIAAFVAIAKDDIRQETWFLLGRTSHALEHGHPVLLSWTGTMFEYLMPLLWMRTYPNTLLERSARAAVRLQQTYVENRGIPWGISESAYFRTDEAGNYQYYAFGVPKLALNKGELNALVVSPYSSFLALHVCASDALKNLHRMSRDGWLGAYGFYEAADFTPARRRSRFHRYELVRCWMAHHQGMVACSRLLTSCTMESYSAGSIVIRRCKPPNCCCTRNLLPTVLRTRMNYGANAA